jgi:hypothetical protein
MPAMIAAMSASPPMTPPTIGPTGVELLDCGVEVVVEVGVVGVIDFERDVGLGVGVVGLEDTGVVLVVVCAAWSRFVSVRPSCPA